MDTAALAQQNGAQPESQPDRREIDMQQMLTIIGEYEMVKRMMAEDIARLQAENASLREQISEASESS